MPVPTSSVFLGMLIEEVFVTSNKIIFKTIHNYSVLKRGEQFDLFHLQAFSYYLLVIIAATYSHNFCFQKETLRDKRKQ